MIGERLKFLRNKRNLLQKDLAEKLSLSQQTISLYESEKRQPDYQILQNIADFFNVSVDYLLGRTDIKEPISYVPEEIKEGHPIQEDDVKYHTGNTITKEIQDLSVESQEDLKKYLELLKIKDKQKRNTELSDELTGLD